MLYLIVFLFCVAVALGTGLLAGWSDFKGMTIPNVCPLIVIGAFIPAFLAVRLSGADIMEPLTSHLTAAGVVMAVTVVLYAVKIIGGGDSKLMSAFSLWAGVPGLAAFLFYMSLVGAAIGIVTIVIRKKKPFKNAPEKSWIARAQNGDNGVPYGIAIVIGAVVCFWQQGYLSPDSLMLFINSGGN